MQPFETTEGRPDEGPAGGIIDCAGYAGGRRAADLKIAEARDFMAGDPARFVWIGLYEPGEELLLQVQREFGLHDLAIEDAHTAHQRPKVELYHDSLFIVLRTARLVDEGRTEFGETHVFVGAQYLVTVRHGSLRSHTGLRTRCEATPGLLAKGTAYVLYALMDFVVDQYLPILEVLDDRLEALEERIFGDAPQRGTTHEIYELKRQILGLQRAVAPLADMCARLIRIETPLVPADTRLYFRDVLDQVMRIQEALDNFRELLGSALDANLSLISVAQNDDVKRLAAWAAILAVPTMVAGVYGMNFRVMPELEWSWGYPTILSGMAIACASLWIGFRRSGWL
jgi:magnesium transporter